jgi:hypothetical protein
MSWYDHTTCPLCNSPGFLPDCDEVDIGVGVIEGNLRGCCTACREVAQCEVCGEWISDTDPIHVHPEGASMREPA